MKRGDEVVIPSGKHIGKAGIITKITGKVVTIKPYGVNYRVEVRREEFDD